MYEIIDNKALNVNIAYIGGGSRGWAWTLMRDLKSATDISGEVRLYDIDYNAAKVNDIIGNSLSGRFVYRAVKTTEEALTGADFVIISILPGTFDEMESDVHAPERYGIYQSVGDTTGAGGFVRALRTIPQIREIAAGIRKYCPNAWVINYTNPMAICVQTLYREFPKIKAFGCCHEVFGTQKLLAEMLEDIKGIKNVTRHDIQTNVVGVNHFTWFTEARYKNLDLFPLYREFYDKYAACGFEKGKGVSWKENCFASAERVKLDLFKRFGYIAAAGDRHLAEFMNAEDYLASPEAVIGWMFGLTSVQWRKDDLKNRLERSERLKNGTESFPDDASDEEGVNQMRALLGLSALVTNINIPNVGQIPNLPLGTVVETNAVLRSNSLKPVVAGEIPESIYYYVSRIAAENSEAVEAGFGLNLKNAYKAFSKSHMLVSLSEEQKRELYAVMIKDTSDYLNEYDDVKEFL